MVGSFTHDIYFPPSLLEASESLSKEKNQSPDIFFPQFRSHISWKIILQTLCRECVQLHLRGFSWVTRSCNKSCSTEAIAEGIPWWQNTLDTLRVHLCPSPFAVSEHPAAMKIVPEFCLLIFVPLLCPVIAAPPQARIAHCNKSYIVTSPSLSF